MKLGWPPLPASSLTGPVLALLSYLLFSIQDAAIKWLVADYSVWQILFMRSLSVAALCVAVGGAPLVRRVTASRNKWPLLFRGLVVLVAWLCYYNAARDLQLAELVTIYFAAPLLLVALSVAILRERVGWARWLGTGLGFVGVLIACRPASVGFSLPVALTLLAALLWAYAAILVRQISAFESTPMQMLFSSLVFILACGIAMPWVWKTPSAGEMLAMVALGLWSAGAQYLILESYRLALASLIAPCEYSSLLWAFCLSYLVWGDVPPMLVFAGAAIIIVGGTIAVLSERRGAPEG